MKLEPINADDQRFAEWHEVLARAYAQDREPGWWESLSATRAYFSRPATRTRHLGIVAIEDQVVVGGAELNLPLDEDLATISVELGVESDHRRRGVGSALAAAVRDLAAEHGRSIVQSEVFVPVETNWEDWPGARFAERYGLRSVSTEHRYALSLTGLNLTGLELTGLELPRVDGAEDLVSFVGPCPPRYEAEWARMRTQMNEDVPTGALTVTARKIDVERIRESDRTMIEQGWTKVRTMALGADGAGLGYTELFVSAHDPDVVVQDDTLVDRAHRGHGLGLRLKVANLHQLRSHDGGRLLGGRHTVQTYVEQDNLAMQRTNERMGFRRVDTLHECEGTLT